MKNKLINQMAKRKEEPLSLDYKFRPGKSFLTQSIW